MNKITILDNGFVQFNAIPFGAVIEYNGTCYIKIDNGNHPKLSHNLLSLQDGALFWLNPLFSYKVINSLNIINNNDKNLAGRSSGPTE